jgi:hypothetical protein
MAKGGRKYNRDSRGRFASSGGGGGKSAGKASKPAASSAPKAKGSGRGKAKPADAPKAANKIAASPRRLNKAEQDYAEISAQKSKFRSDKKVREEMMRRGHLKGSDPQGELIRIAVSTRSKKGDNPPYMNNWLNAKPLPDSGPKPRRRQPKPKP